MTNSQLEKMHAARVAKGIALPSSSPPSNGVAILRFREEPRAVRAKRRINS